MTEELHRNPRNDHGFAIPVAMLIVLLLSILSVTVINTADADVRAQVRQGSTFDARFTSENALEHYYAALLQDPSLLEDANITAYPAAHLSTDPARWTRFDSDGTLVACPTAEIEHEDCFSLSVFKGGRDDAALVEARVRYDCTDDGCREATEVLTLRRPSFTQFLHLTDFERSDPLDPLGLGAGNQVVSWQGQIGTPPIDYTRVVEGWGSGQYRLATGTSTSATGTPVEWADSTGISSIDADDRVVCFIRDGGLWCRGWNASGAVGNGSVASAEVTAPHEVFAAGSGVTQVSVSDHVCAIVSGGLYCWGNNTDGQVGNGTTSATVASPHEVFASGSNVLRVATGSGHTCANVDREVFCWGRDTSGQVGNGAASTADVTTPTRITFPDTGTTGVGDIAAGDSHTCVERYRGLFCWGSDSQGQIGNGGTTGNQNSPVQVINYPTAPAVGVTRVAAGTLNTCVIQDGGVRCWGDGAQGVNGTGSTGDTTSPNTYALSSGAVDLSLKTYHVCAATVSGAVNDVHCWGRNTSGEIGLGTIGGTRTTPHTVFSGTDLIADISAGEITSYAIFDTPTASLSGVRVDSTAFRPSSGNTLTIPADVEEGDLLVLFSSQYASATPSLTGWTTIETRTGSGTYTTHGRVQWKWATASDAGSNLNVTTQSSYGAAALAVISGADPDNPIDVDGSTGAGTSTITAPAVTATDDGLRLSYAAQMANGSTTPTFTRPASTSELGATAAANYFRGALYLDTERAAAGSVSARTVASNQSGGNVGHTVVIREAPVPAPGSVAVRATASTEVPGSGATLRAHAHKTGNGTSLTLPSSIQPGDLLVLFTGQYNSSPPSLSGWTTIDTRTGPGPSTATWATSFGRVQWKWATAADAGATITATSNTSYSGASVAVITGANPTTPISAVSSTASSSTPITAPGVASADGGLRLSYFHQMSNNGVVPSFGSAADASLLGQTASSSYHRGALWSDNAPTTGAAVPARTVTTNVQGGNVGHTVTINPSAPPTTTPPGHVRIPDTTEDGDLLVMFASQGASPASTPAVRASAMRAGGTNTMQIPAAAQAGDLLVLFSSQYNSAPPLPSGWTSLTTRTGSSTYTEYGLVAWKWATASDPGSTITVNNSSGSSYGGAHIVAITGANTTSPFAGFNSQGSGTSTITAPATSTTTGGLRFSYAAQMSNSSTIPNFTTPSGTIVVGSMTSSSWHHRSALYRDISLAAPGTTPSRSVSSTQVGGNVGFTVVIAGATSPVTSTGLPPTPTGWTSLTDDSHTASGVSAYGRVSYRWATAADAGTTVPAVGTDPFSSAHLIVVANADPTNPFDGHGSAAGSGSLPAAPSVSATEGGLRLAFVGHQTNGASGTITRPIGTTILATWNDPDRHSSGALRTSELVAAGSVPAMNIPISESGSWVGHTVVLRQDPVAILDATAEYIIGDVVRGPIHTNDSAIYVCRDPRFYGDVSVAGPAVFTLASDVFAGDLCDPEGADPTDPNSWLRGGATISSSPVLSFPSSPAGLADIARSSGYYYEDAGGPIPPTVRYARDGQVFVNGVNPATSTGPTLTWATTPLNGLIYIETDRAVILEGETTPEAPRISGVVFGRQHLATDARIVVLGSTEYQCRVDNTGCGPGGDMLGITATEGVELQPWGDRDLILDAAILVLDGAIHNRNALATAPADPPAFRLYGSISTRYRSIIGFYEPTDGTLASGMAKVWEFDPRLTDETPPFFLPPSQGVWLRVDSAATRPGADVLPTG